MSTAPPLALDRRHVEFLTALASAFPRALMYPGGHPTLDRALDQVLQRAEPLLADAPAVLFAVGPTQLFVGDAASDPDHPQLHEFAARLFRRNVGRIRMARGITRPELAALVRALGPEEPSLGDFAAPHLEIDAISFDRLALDGGRGGDEAPDPVAVIWSGLARALLGPGGSEAGTTLSTDGGELARGFDALPASDERDAEIARHLHEAAVACRDRPAPQAASLRHQVSQLLGELRPATLERLIRARRGAGLDSRLTLDLTDVTSAPLALDLLRAASRVEGRSLSPALIGLLGKLATHAETGPGVSRRLAEAQLQGALRELIQGWTEPAVSDQEAPAELEPLGYLPEPLVPDLDPTEAYRSDPLRILTMQLDMGEIASPGRRAVRTLVARARIRPLLRLLDEAPPEDPMASQVRPLVATLDTVVALLASRPLDLETLERLAPEVGVAAIPLLLDALADAEDRGVRRRLLELVARFGNAVTPHALSRLDGAPWYVQRNLLRLMQLLSEPPAEAVASRFAQHEDIRVRIEGLRLLLLHPAARARGIVQGLTDPDPSGVRVAVMAAAENCPPAAAPLLLRGLLEGRIDPELRTSAIRAVGPLVEEPAVLELLLKVAAWRVPLLGPRVALKSRESLAALAALARHWHWHPRVGKLLGRAERHRDPEIRQAVATPSVLQQFGVEPATE